MFVYPKRALCYLKKKTKITAKRFTMIAEFYILFSEYRRFEHHYQFDTQHGAYKFSSIHNI